MQNRLIKGSGSKVGGEVYCAEFWDDCLVE